MMTTIEVTKIKEQTGGRLFFNVRAQTTQGRIEFPVGTQRLETSVLDEPAVLRSTLDFADDLQASLRLRSALQPRRRNTYPDAVCAVEVAVMQSAASVTVSVALAEP